MAALGLCLAYKELPISAYFQRQFSTLQLGLKEGQPICSQYKGVNFGNFFVFWEIKSPVTLKSLQFNFAATQG